MNTNKVKITYEHLRILTIKHLTLILLSLYHFQCISSKEEESLKGDHQAQLRITDSYQCQNQIINGNNNIQICLTVEDYRTSLLEKLQSIQARIANSQPKQELNQLITKQKEIGKKLQSINASYTHRVDELRKSITKIDELQGIVNKRRSEEAKRELTMGRTHAARELFIKGEYELRLRLSQIEKRKQVARETFEQEQRALDKTLKDIANTSYELGAIEQAEFNYIAAEKSYRKSIKATPDNYKYHLQLGLVLSVRGSYDQANKLLEKALELSLKKFGTNHLSVARVYNSLCRLQFEMGKYNIATTHCRRAISIYKKLSNPPILDISRSYRNLGFILTYKGEYNHAAESSQKALELMIKFYGKDNPMTATEYQSLGFVLFYKGEYERSIELYQKALTLITQTSFGKTNPEEIYLHQNLGNALFYKGKYHEAKEHYEKALDMGIRVFGVEHARVALIHICLGFVWYYMGEYGRALQLYSKALNIMVKKVGPEHYNVAGTYTNMGLAWHAIGQYDKSLIFCQEAKKIVSNSLGKDHPLLLEVYDCLGRIRASQGEYRKAENRFNQAIDIGKEKLGPNHLDMALPHFGLAKVLKKTKKIAKAKAQAKRACKIFSAKLSESHPRTQPVCQLYTELLEINLLE